MKKHILSKFSEQKNNIIRNRGIQGLVVTGEETSSVEVSDPEEVVLMGATYVTENVENSDPDEFVAMGTTRITELIENSDSGELLLMEPTKQTFNMENSDVDEFQINNLVLMIDSDFDEFLYI